MTPEIEPTANRIIVSPVRERVTAGGIHIPDTNEDGPQFAVVLAVGPGRRDNGEQFEMPFKSKDRVLIAKYAGVEVEIGQEKLRILREDDILGICR